MKIKNIQGHTFGRLTVLEFSHVDKYRGAHWLCLCKCGATKTIRGSDLRQGKIQSCSCYRKENTRRRAYIHGHTQQYRPSSTYTSWQNMIARSLNPKSNEYHNYGARGITVCERWLHSFANFLEDMGEKPRGMTLERMNNSKGYSPDNCEWTSPFKQSRNTRRNWWITYQGQTRCLTDWSGIVNINYTTLRSRLKSGLTVEEAFTRPIGRWA